MVSKGVTLQYIRQNMSDSKKRMVVKFAYTSTVKNDKDLDMI